MYVSVIKECILARAKGPPNLPAHRKPHTYTNPSFTKMNNRVYYIVYLLPYQKATAAVSNCQSMQVNTPKCWNLSLTKRKLQA